MPAVGEDPWLTEEQQRVWRSFLQFTGLLGEHLDRDLRRSADIPHTYYQVLAMLSEAPEFSLRMSELAAATWVSPSRMSHAVARLEELGWVTRARDVADGRGQIARLTAAGWARLREIAPRHVAAVRHILFDGLDDEQLRIFGEVCDVALARLAQTRESPNGNGGYESGSRHRL